MKFLDKIGIAYLWDQIINYIRIVTETIDKNKQDKLIGKQKQIVTFDEAGAAKAEDVTNLVDFETGTCELYLGQNNLAKSTYASYIKTNGYVYIFATWNNVLCGTGAGAGFFKGLPFPVGRGAESELTPDVVPIIGTMMMSGNNPRPIRVPIGKVDGTFDCEWPTYMSGSACISYPVN